MLHFFKNHCIKILIGAGSSPTNLQTNNGSIMQNASSPRDVQGDLSGLGMLYRMGALVNILVHNHGVVTCSAVSKSRHKVKHNIGEKYWVFQKDTRKSK